jgi:hypothetical protein
VTVMTVVMVVWSGGRPGRMLGYTAREEQVVVWPCEPCQCCRSGCLHVFPQSPLTFCLAVSCCPAGEEAQKVPRYHRLLPALQCCVAIFCLLQYESVCTLPALNPSSLRLLLLLLRLKSLPLPAKAHDLQKNPQGANKPCPETGRRDHPSF